ncbi:hypothetical protein EXW39_15895 [Bacillus mycoides]|nr:hypothetical protein EXW39_15895 [Bacillus mycoides]
MQLINQFFLIKITQLPLIISMPPLKKVIAFPKMKNYVSFYNLIVTIFPRNGVSITVLNFNLTIIE